MSTLIMKFGGAALKSPDSFLNVAEIIIGKVASHSHIIVVVSAMGDMTDNLMDLSYQVSKNPPQREQDMLISVGERISMSLLAMALKERGHEAISLTGSQSGIITCSRHSEARIIAMRPSRLIQHMNEGKIVIVAGFQGVSRTKEITTLGRGGSDTSAVALGVALKASKVEFYKDVKGVYAKDPKKEEGHPFSSLNYEEALKLSKKSAFILHSRAILLASKNKVPLHVLSFRKDERELFSGTWITEGVDAKTTVKKEYAL